MPSTSLGVLSFVVAAAKSATRAIALLFVLAAALAAPARADVTGVVRGSVTVNGLPRAGVVVTARGEGVTTTAITNVHGSFTFSRLAFGRYTFTAHTGTGLDARADVDVTSDSVADISLALGAAATIGRITANAAGVGGNPISVTTLTSADIQAAPQNQNLNRLIETVPGIVRFSYDEPVAHGFHGVAYEIDGAPIPQTTSSSFAQIFDPRNIDSVEVFTGAFPAEFGGERDGALVNIVTKRDVDIPNGSETIVTPGFGSYATQQINFSQATRLGATDVFFNANGQDNSRGLDTPSLVIQNDAASLTDEFLRTITRLGASDTLSLDISNQYNTYQIPINTTLTDVDSIVNVGTQDDVQREYNSFVNLNYTHTSLDGMSYFQIIPWERSSRIVYAGDLANDVLALDYSPDDCAPAAPPCSLAGLAQDRRATVFGLRTAYGATIGRNTLKFGVSGSFENFTSAETLAQAGSDPFSDNVAQRGTTLSAYAQDRWTPSPAFSLQAGLRYDRSTGFVDGNQLQTAHRCEHRTRSHDDRARVLRAPLRRTRSRGHATRRRGDRRRHRFSVAALRSQTANGIVLRSGHRADVRRRHHRLDHRLATQCLERDRYDAALSDADLCHI